MDVILSGLASALTVPNLALIAFGVFVGITVGAIPGLNGPMAIAIAIPLTFVLSPVRKKLLVMVPVPGSPTPAAVTLRNPVVPKIGKPCADWASSSSLSSEKVMDLLTERALKIPRRTRS